MKRLCKGVNLVSGLRSTGSLPLLLATLLMVSAGGPLQAATSPTEQLLLMASTTTTDPTTPQPGTTETGTPTTETGGTTTPAPAPLPLIPPPPNQSPIRIGLGRSLTTGQTKAAQGLYILADERLVATTAPGATVSFALVPTGQIQLGGEIQPVSTGSTGAIPTTMAPVSGTIRIVPMPAAPPLANWVTWSNKPYRGQAEIKRSISGQLTFINLLNLEEYLYGVVPEEMPSSWPSEALKAQAVAARTFAIRRMGGYLAEGFDLTATTSDQAYGGVSEEAATSTAAVQATTGEVVRYGTKLVETYYHSSSGGHTEAVSTVWGGTAQPYLVGVPDFDNLPGNRNYQWSAPFSLADLKSRFAAKGIDVGEIITITPAGAVGYPGGRPPSWKLTGTKGEKTISGESLRFALGLLSSPRVAKYLSATGTPVTASAVAGSLANVGSTSTTTTAPAPQTVKVLGANGKLIDRPVQGAVVLGAAAKTVTLDGTATAQGANGNQVAFQPPPPPPPTPTPTPTIATIQFDGGGYGHGIGMSQWGAYGMALQGKTYRDILTYYYQNTKVERP